jgi:hypothetical protein
MDAGLVHTDADHKTEPIPIGLARQWKAVPRRMLSGIPTTPGGGPMYGRRNASRPLCDRRRPSGEDMKIRRSAEVTNLPGSVVRLTMQPLDQRSRLWAVPAAVLLALVASCGSGTGSAATTPTASAAASTQASPSPSSSGGSCQPSTGASLTGSTATLSHSGYPFTFSYPASWTDNTGSVTVTVGPLLDAQTLTAVGLQPSSTVSFVQVADPSLMPALDVYRFSLQNGSLTLDTFYQREQTLLSQQTATQIGQAGLSDCVAGQPVEGLELTAVTGGAFQKNWFAVRNGSLYDIQFIAASSADAATLAGILATWDWSS